MEGGSRAFDGRGSGFGDLEVEDMLAAGATMESIRQWGYLESDIYEDDPDSREEF